MPLGDPLTIGVVCQGYRPSGDIRIINILSETRGIRDCLKLYTSVLSDLNHNPLTLLQSRTFPLGLKYHVLAIILFTLRRTKSLAMERNPAARAWVIPTVQDVLSNLPSGATSPTFSPLYHSNNGLHHQASVTTLFIRGGGVMSWCPTLEQLREIIHPLLNWSHARSLAWKHCTRNFFPLPEGPRTSAAPTTYNQTVYNNDSGAYGQSLDGALVLDALRELIPLLNVAPSCTVPQWASLPFNDFVVPHPQAYDSPLPMSQASPPLPHATSRVHDTPPATDSEDDLDPHSPACECSPSFRGRLPPSESDDAVNPQLSEELIHALHGLVFIKNSISPLPIREFSTEAAARMGHKQATSTPLPNAAAVLSAPYVIPMIDPVGMVACGEICHSLSTHGNLIHTWCVEPSLDPTVLPHPLDETIILALCQPITSRRAFFRKFLGTWVTYPPAPTGTVMHFRLPPPGVFTFTNSRVIVSMADISELAFFPSVIYADGSQTADTGAYLSALGLLPAEIERLGSSVDYATLRSIFRKTVSHDGVNFAELVRKCQLADYNGEGLLLPCSFKGLFLGSRFNDWTKREDVLFASAVDVHNNAFVGNAPGVNEDAHSDPEESDSEVESIYSGNMDSPSDAEDDSDADSGYNRAASLIPPLFPVDYSDAQLQGPAPVVYSDAQIQVPALIPDTGANAVPDSGADMYVMVGSHGQLMHVPADNVAVQLAEASA